MNDARISLKAAAARLGIAPDLAAQAIADGQWQFLGAHKIGERTYVIPRAPFERWLTEGEMPGVMNNHVEIAINGNAAPEELARQIFEQVVRALPARPGK